MKLIRHVAGIPGAKKQCCARCSVVIARRERPFKPEHRKRRGEALSAPFPRGEVVMEYPGGHFQAGQTEAWNARDCKAAYNSRHERKR